MKKAKESLIDLVFIAMLTGVLLGAFGYHTMDLLRHGENMELMIVIIGLIGMIGVVLVILKSLAVNDQFKDDYITIQEREREYALLLAKFLSHVDQIDQSLRRRSAEDGAMAPENITTRVRKLVKVDWAWIDDSTLAPPPHQEILEIVEDTTDKGNQLKLYLNDQINGAWWIRMDCEIATISLFEQVDKLWKLRPAHSGVRNVRQIISSVAWMLMQNLGGYVVNGCLNKVAPQALAWLVTHREPQHNRHVRRLEHYVLHGTLPNDADSETETGTEPTPEPTPAG